MKLNRQQRRDAARDAKRPHKPQRRLVINAHALVTDLSRPYDPDDLMEEHNKMHLALVKLTEGIGTRDNFDRVSMLLNIGRIRAEAINPGLEQTIITGQQAMIRMKDRYDRGLNFGFDAEGRISVPAALDVYEALADASSPLQLRQARDLVLEIAGTHKFKERGFVCPV